MPASNHAKQTRKFNWELKGRHETMSQAYHDAELLMSVVHAKKAKIAKEGRGYSTYIHYERPKLTKWGK
jgi:hypothetical protein